MPFAPSVGWLVALRAVQGAAIAGIPASAMAYLAEEVGPKALVAAIGLFVAGNSIGGMSGRLVTGWVAQLWGWRAALAAVGAAGGGVRRRLPVADPQGPELHARLAEPARAGADRRRPPAPIRCCCGCTRSARCS